MTIINFDDIIGKKFKTITNNVFCLNHPTNCTLSLERKIQEKQMLLLI